MGLKRVLGSADAAWLVAGNMIGAGIFITPGFVAGHLPGLILPLAAWILGGLLALCGAAVYAELGARIPRAGGDYQYLSKAFGPAWGFLTGWSALVLTFSAAAAAMCKVALDYAWTAWSSGETAPWPVRVLVPPALVLGLTLANLAGVRFAGRTTALLTAIPLVGLVATFGLGLLAGHGAPRWPQPFVAPEQAWPLALGAAMVPVFFTYSGWNVAAYVAGELKDPARNLARALLTGAAAVTVLYLAVNLVLLAVLSDGLAGNPTPGAEAVRILLGPGAERLLAMIVAVAILGSANVTLMAGARIYYAMALDGLAPRPLARTNSRGVPSAALWSGGVWSAALAATTGVSELVSWATLAILLLSSMTVAALFVLRKRDPDGSPFACPGYPVTPLIYLFASLGVAVASTVYDPQRALWGLLLVLAGLPVYALAHGRFKGAR